MDLVYHLDRPIRAPFHIQLVCFVDVVYLAVVDAHSTGQRILDSAEEWVVVGIQNIFSCGEYLLNDPVLPEEGVLVLRHYKSGVHVEILVWDLPDQ